MTKRCLPLYEAEFPPIKPDSHSGLCFDKFCDHWSGSPNWKPEVPNKNEVAPRTDFLTSIADHINQNRQAVELTRHYLARRKKLIEALQGESYLFGTSWRFVSGIGMGHVLETGFVWHRTLGIPYLPGSSLKGMMHAYAKLCEKETEHLFGSNSSGAGQIIVFDAIPNFRSESEKIVEMDIMNPHYGDYYSGKSKNGEPIPPADYLSPNPILFLTVADNVVFEFALGSRLPARENKEILQDAFEIMKGALENLGAGAKTAIGYGFWEEFKT